MTTTQITIGELASADLAAAVTLSRQAGWPHRREDWAMMLALSTGVAAFEDGRVVGTAMMTPFGEDIATINMVIVDEAMRGRGLGRKLMQAALDAAGGRTCLLVATKDGLPLYEKLGFVATSEIAQHQGVASKVEAPDNVTWATTGDHERIRVLDRLAKKYDRSELMRLLDERARFVVIRPEGQVEAFAAVRRFGQGLVVGPVVARDAAEARALISFVLSNHAGEFVRVDTDRSTNLAPWLTEHGLSHVGGGVTMRRGADVRAAASEPYQTYALVNQALG